MEKQIKLFSKPAFDDVQVGLFSDKEQNYIPIGEAKEDTCTLDEEELITAPKAISACFTCKMDAKEYASWFMHPSQRLYKIAAQFRPKVTRIINYKAYIQRWHKATSIRKAKKYARLLGINYTYNERYTFAFNIGLPSMYIFSKCKVEQSVDEAGKINTRITVLKNK
jgi:hypothetical protein